MSLFCRHSMPLNLSFLFFFFNETATTEIYTLSLHDALPIGIQHRTKRASRFESGHPHQPIHHVAGAKPFPAEAPEPLTPIHDRRRVEYTRLLVDKRAAVVDAE